MPKRKTRKAAAKRVKISGGGKLLMRHARTGHMKARKSENEKRRLAVPVEVSKSDAQAMKRELPYYKKEKGKE